MKKITSVLPILLLAIGIIGLVLLVKNRPQKPALKAVEKSWAVTTFSAKPQTLTPHLTLYAQIESRHHATLSASLSTTVDQIKVQEGQAVQPNQILLQLDARDAELQLQQRQASLAEITALITSEHNTYQTNQAALVHEKNLLQLQQKAVKRAQTMKRKQLGAQSTIEEQRQNVERQALNLNTREFNIKNHTAKLSQLNARKRQAQALVKQAALALERTTIKAPFAGKITKILVSPGDWVRNGSNLIRLYDTQQLEARSQIPQRHLATIQQAITQQLSLSADSQNLPHTLRFQLDRLAAQVQAKQGGLDAFFKPENNTHLYLGQFITLKLSLPPEANVIPIPYAAIYGDNLIYKMVDQRMQAIKIERVGDYYQANNKKLLIRSQQLKPGDNIIATPLPNAINGLKVHVSKP